MFRQLFLIALPLVLATDSSSSVETETENFPVKIISPISVSFPRCLRDGPAYNCIITPKIIGSGSYGKVYEAYSTSENELIYHRNTSFPGYIHSNTVKYAVKIVDKNRSYKCRYIGGKLCLEPLVLKLINYWKIPGTIKLLGNISTPKYSVMLTSFVSGKTLGNYLRKNSGSVPFSIIRNIIRSLSKTLFHLEKRNLCHRDFDSSNVMFDPVTGQVTIIDFGISGFSPRVNKMVAPLKIVDDYPGVSKHCSDKANFWKLIIQLSSAIQKDEKEAFSALSRRWKSVISQNYFYVYVYNSLSIRSPIQGHLAESLH